MTLLLEHTKDDLAVGIMGGTFDPIHMGHLVIAEEVRIQFDLDRVIFVPTGYPPHKEKSRISHPEHRYLMTVLATISNPFFTVSRVEIDRIIHEHTYTIDTIRFFYNHFGGKAKLYFITGADAFADILSWRDYHELLSICSFIAATRPGYSLNTLEETIGKNSPELLANIHVLEIPAVAISSTMIRQRVAAGKPIKYLAPETVAQYILKNGLYRNMQP